ncbi:hypothetical protein MPSEU_000044200 [Mayamaea pseudoterrestris]|nr:hypothetical protein MPSEU_000044200 [Mayamaea pseudoterrestris]
MVSSFTFLSCCYLSMTAPNSQSSIDSDVAKLQRRQTARELKSSLDASTTASTFLYDYTESMTERAKQRLPFTSEEIDKIIDSLDNVRPVEHEIPRAELARLLLEVAHLPHTDWPSTEANAKRLGSILAGADNDESGLLNADAPFRQVLERILREGNWNEAAKHAADLSASKKQVVEQPWVVLVTGVNGIRKSTSMYMPWFSQLLQEAVVVPTGAIGAATNVSHLDSTGSVSLPTGQNSFFRQLDHMISTLCNEEFAMLYQLTAKRVRLQQGDPPGSPSSDIIDDYSNLKAAIFSRYRTISEVLGAWLLNQAQVLGMNCLLESSGRDVAMFHYVDYLFPKGYRKLALHFQINDLSLAKTSVDQRMMREILLGTQAVAAGDVFEVINANAGGPYGSSVLDEIQRESDQVWNDQIVPGKVASDWYKATIQINAHATEPWTAQAVKSDGSLGRLYRFPDKSAAMHIGDNEANS